MKLVEGKLVSCNGSSERLQKKWQTCKDSNLNKVNQNHLCYRYTTGLRLAYNIARLFVKSKPVGAENPRRGVVGRWSHMPGMVSVPSVTLPLLNTVFLIAISEALG